MKKKKKNKKTAKFFSFINYYLGKKIFIILLNQIIVIFIKNK